MNPSLLVSKRLLLCACLVAAACPGAAQIQVSIAPNPEQPDQPFTLSWVAVPGLRYQVLTSSNLAEPWEPMLAFPREATGAVESYDLPASDSSYFRIIELSTGVPEGFSFIPAGSFSRRVTRSHRTATISQPFYIAATEITKAQWDMVREWALTNGYTDLPEGTGGFQGDGSHPVTEVSWHDVVKWCNARSQMEDLTPVYKVLATVYQVGESNVVTCDWTANGYRLPTEAEWELACRGRTTTALYTGPITAPGYSPVDPNLDLAGWYLGNSGGDNTHPVGQKQANAWGLHDTHGNVWEWCWDWFAGYDTQDVTDPKGPPMGTYRVYRGGAWSYPASFCASDYRRDGWADVRYINLGFRTARAISGE